MKKNSINAHTPNNKGQWHLLEDHLIGVAELMRQMTSSYYKGNVSGLSVLIGCTHDAGKYPPAFQDYLINVQYNPNILKVPHSYPGAWLIWKLFEKTGLQYDICLPIAGHHGGLNEPGSLSAKIAKIPISEELTEEMIDYIRDILIKASPATIKIGELSSLQRELLIRMIFSALIDADRLDTEKHFNEDKADKRKGKNTLDELKKVFIKDQETLLKKSKGKVSKVNNLRREVYYSCTNAAKQGRGIFRLTVPTGGGKTRSSLAFALDHAIHNNQERIIFALPYTSIIDQTAKVYREIFGNEAVLEHHSQVLVDDDLGENEGLVKLRLAEENWDAPLIVTTTVQLLESLFSNRPSKCRKIHNLARSVIIFDEAQTLPPDLLCSTMQVIRDLVENYEVTVVLSTATQPAFKKEYLPELEGLEIKEIISDYNKYFQDQKRVVYELLPKKTITELAKEIADYQQVLVILNTRKKALEMVKAIKDLGEECFHLSTLLCGAHRRDVLDEVRHRLSNGLPVRLISTQVVEAGVDLDFPVVYRDMGPLDRIVQAAGRCNREGEETPGIVKIFTIDETPPGGPYKAGIEEAKLLLFEAQSAEVLHDPDIFNEYFTRLYRSLGADLDKYKVQDKRSELNYPATASAYRLIREDTVPVVVRYKNYKIVLDEWLFSPSRDSWRQLHPYLVNIYKQDLNKLYADGMIASLSNTQELFMWEGVYDDVLGLACVQRDPADFIF